MKDLMQQRWKVIGTWPDMTEKVGDIITLPSEAHRYGDLLETYCGDEYFKEFPCCYKKLEWYEDRELSEMPEYLKWQNNGKVRKVKKYITWMGIIEVEFEGGRTRKLKPEWTPCTEAEYQTYLSTLK